MSNNNEVLFCNNFCGSAVVLSPCLTIMRQECIIPQGDLRAIVEIFRGFWVFFLSLSRFADGVNALPQWVVPEKNIGRSGFE